MSHSADNMPVFQVSNLRKAFGRTKVLRGISLTIEQGRTTVIIGASGCGKSVFLKHLIGLLRPDRGHILFDGERVERLKEAQLISIRQRCGFMFQSGALFDSQTVAQNVAFPLIEHTHFTLKEIDDIVDEKLAQVGMPGMRDRLPAELSGGQQRRVALARAIALSPDVIFYDEPTTGLDPIRADAINELILKMKATHHITSIVVTHDMHSAYKIADRIIMFKDGTVVADGKAEDIRNSTDPAVQQFIHGRSDTVTA